MTFNDEVIRLGIARDAAYGGSVMADLSAGGYHTLIFAVVPFLSLTVHESYAKIAALDPVLAATLSVDVQQIVARSRHSLKLFDDNRRGVDGQVAYFRDEILPAHRRHFIDPVLPVLRRWRGRDLGLFTYDGALVATTHSATFHTGLMPDEVLTASGPSIRAIYQEYGHFSGALGAGTDTGHTFVHNLDPHRMQSVDVRADRYYPRVFAGVEPDLSTVLTVFQAMLNTAELVGRAPCTPAEYTPFKIRYLTLYQVLSSLRLLRRQHSQSLPGYFCDAIDRMTNSAAATLILSQPARSLRNTLTHYNPTAVDPAAVDLEAPLFGLIPCTCLGMTRTPSRRWSTTASRRQPLT